jgi:hypothetical protein
MKEYEKSSTILLRRFYVRRAYRILTAAMAFMVPVFVIYWHELRWYHMAARALYVVNFEIRGFSATVVNQRAGAVLVLVAERAAKVVSTASADFGGRGCVRSRLSRGMPLSAAPWKGR